MFISPREKVYKSAKKCDPVHNYGPFYSREPMFPDLLTHFTPSRILKQGVETEIMNKMFISPREKVYKTGIFAIKMSKTG